MVESVIQIPGQSLIIGSGSLKRAISQTQPLIICPFTNKRNAEADRSRSGDYNGEPAEKQLK
jgi:hypothetical protein